MTREYKCSVGTLPECGRFANETILYNHCKEEHDCQLLYECGICGEEKILPQKTTTGAIVRRLYCDGCIGSDNRLEKLSLEIISFGDTE